ncbi:unnamed protein product [Thlaspi arvense]|uniref:Alpha-D-phosphohexomutase alpha/beta/alpha domain-containing protein n=1 Tax=Thlaspi arvense TaxID=13288 RepID=A0AAU9SAI7_THLAR|nr:unnamed protein product [Thlaspi arvense]
MTPTQRQQTTACALIQLDAGKSKRHQQLYFQTQRLLFWISGKLSICHVLPSCSRCFSTWNSRHGRDKEKNETITKLPLNLPSQFQCPRNPATTPEQLCSLLLPVSSLPSPKRFAVKPGKLFDVLGAAIGLFSDSALGFSFLGKFWTVTLTPAAVEAIAESFGEWVAATEGNGNGVIRVSLGRDPRVSGGKLNTAVFAGLSRAGCLAFDMGLATTPACFMSTLLSPFEYDASIMMTASHLPYTRNGLKFFTKRGGLASPGVEKICDLAARKYANRQTKVSTLIRTRPQQVDFMSACSSTLGISLKRESITMSITTLL